MLKLKKDNKNTFELLSPRFYTKPNYMFELCIYSYDIFSFL
ncbi:MAG: hypothetical protein K0R59_2525 [Sphingobacterium sp.]|jgi:hypothetical protein|nr:hypothetical protein [Sphingobacterium sp.]